MHNKQNVLDFKVRKKLYDLLSKNPGLHLREIERKINFSFGALRYHIDYLQRKGLIKTLPDNGFTRYYITNKVGNGDKILLTAFRQETLRKILIIFLLEEQEGIFFKEDLRNLPNIKHWHNPERFQILRHRTTLEFHLKKLVEYGILETVKVKRKTGYKLVKSENIWEFLIRFMDALDYREIRSLLGWTNNHILPNYVDPTFSSFWEIFPHPYYCH
jgi:predicted transcriptional regulator